MAENGGFGAGVNAGVARARASSAPTSSSCSTRTSRSTGPPSTPWPRQSARSRGAWWRRSWPARRARSGPRAARSTCAPDGRAPWAPRPTRSGSPARAWPRASSLWHEVGGFDEEYVLYWEDVDLSWRVRRGGRRAAGARPTCTRRHEVGGTQADRGHAVPSRSLYYRHKCRGRLLFAAHHLAPRDLVRWVLRRPRYAREVVLRGGRRQLLRSPAPVLAAARGTLEGLVAARGRRHGPARAGGDRGPRLLVAHPSPDLYGSDRQMLETVCAARERRLAGHRRAPGRRPARPAAARARRRGRGHALPGAAQGAAAARRGLPVLAWQRLRAVVRPQPPAASGAPPTSCSSTPSRSPCGSWRRGSPGCPRCATSTRPRRTSTGCSRPGSRRRSCSPSGSSRTARRRDAPSGAALPRVGRQDRRGAQRRAGARRGPAPRHATSRASRGGSYWSAGSRHARARTWRSTRSRCSSRRGLDVTARPVRNGLRRLRVVRGASFASARAGPTSPAGSSFLGYVHPTWPDLARGRRRGGSLSHRAVRQHRGRGRCSRADRSWRAGSRAWPRCSTTGARACWCRRTTPRPSPARSPGSSQDVELRARLAASGRTRRSSGSPRRVTAPPWLAVLDAVARREPPRAGLGSGRDFTRPGADKRPALGRFGRRRPGAIARSPGTSPGEARGDRRGRRMMRALAVWAGRRP